MSKLKRVSVSHARVRDRQGFLIWIQIKMLTVVISYLQKIGLR